MVSVMSFVICFGVNRGVQMVFRYPAKGVGKNLYGASIPLSDDMSSTLGVRTDHLSFLLCPQQIGEHPESDVITVEGFSFHVRYFHIQDRLIRHVAIVLAIEINASPTASKVTGSFLDVFCHAVVREQNRCSYLCTAAHQLTKKRDLCEAPKGTWTAIVAAAMECSLARELVLITDTIQAGGQVRLNVNGWLHIESEGQIQLEPTAVMGLGDTWQAHSSCQHSVSDILASVRGQGGVVANEHRASVDRFTYLMVHPDLPQPVEKHLLSQSVDILREVPLPEYLALIAVPCTIAEFRKALETKLIAAANAELAASQPQSSLSVKKATVSSSPGGRGIVSNGDGVGMKASSFSRLLTWLVGNGIAQLLRTYYVFQPQVFMHAATAAAARRARSSARGASTSSLQSPGPTDSVDIGAEGGMKHLTLAQTSAVPNSPRGTINRQYIERQVVFLEVVARGSRPGRGVLSGSLAGSSVSVIENLRLVIDYLDGKTPKEDILTHVPSVTSEALDEVVHVFNEFITTIVA